MQVIAVPITVCRSGVTLTPAAKAVLLALLSYGGERPPLAQVALDAGVSLRHVYRALAALRAGGYLPAETPPPTTGSGDIVSPSSDMMSPSSDIVSPSSDIVSPSSDMMSPSEANFGGFSASYIYKYNNKEEDKKIEKNRKYNLTAEPSGDDCETPLDVGTTESGEEKNPEAKEALLRWASHPCLAQWHYCDAWAEEYLRMREAFPSREALLEAIDWFGAYHDIKGRNADGFGNNTMHFLRTAAHWISREAASAVVREHQDRFWTRRKTRGRKHWPTSSVRAGAHPGRDPEPDTELIPAVEMIPAAEAEPDPEHRAECLAFLRGPTADDDYARWRFDEQHTGGLRLYVRRPITITQCGPAPMMALATN